MKKDFKDGYGAYLSRSSACKDENKRVVVKITDRYAWFGGRLQRCYRSRHDACMLGKWNMQA